MKTHFTIEVRNSNLPKKEQVWEDYFFGDFYNTEEDASDAIKGCMHFEGCEYRIVPWTRRRVVAKFNSKRKQV